MAFFDKWFGKKEEETRDSSTLSVKNLKTGDFIDYFMSSWEVKNVFHYDWGNNYSSLEYQLYNGKETLFLHVNDDLELELCITKAIAINKINPMLRNIVIDNDEPPSTLDFEGVTYIKQEESQGHVSEESEDFEESYAFVMWDYADKDDKKVLSIVRNGEQDIDAYVGENVDDFEFSNIIPKS